jgi:hypothetical protein
MKTGYVEEFRLRLLDNKNTVTAHTKTTSSAPTTLAATLLNVAPPPTISL